MTKKLAGDEAAMIVAAIAGKTHAEVAEAAGVSVSTVQRRLRDPEIASQIVEGRARYVGDAAGQMGDATREVVSILLESVRSDDPRIALYAIEIWLRNLSRLNRASAGEQSLKLLREVLGAES